MFVAEHGGYLLGQQGLHMTYHGLFGFVQSSCVIGIPERVQPPINLLNELQINRIQTWQLSVICFSTCFKAKTEGLTWYCLVILVILRSMD